MYINFSFILVIVPLFIYKKNLFYCLICLICLNHLGISVDGVYYTVFYYTVFYYTGVYFGISSIVSSIGLSSFGFDSYIIFSSYYSYYIIYFTVGRLSILTKFIISFYKILIMSPLSNL